MPDDRSKTRTYRLKSNTVQAFRTKIELPIFSVSGKAYALPGQWVLTDGDQEWAMDDREFKERYEE